MLLLKKQILYKVSKILIFFSDTSTQIPGWTVPTCHTENVTSTIIEDQHFLNYEPNHLDPLIHSKKTKNYEIQFSYITILHFVLSQIVLVLFYFNLGFLFGNVSDV